MESLKSEALSYLKTALDNPDATFRDGQWEAIARLIDHRERLLVVQRTGWGKSLVYFLATRLLRHQGAGPTLLISPLLALMRNQIQAAQRINIQAATINSSNSEEWSIIEQQLLAGSIDILLISPERLANQDFLDNVMMHTKKLVY
ncbi:DEAD/DEAH box helicase [Arthrospira platensis]|jgi:ATP-dependent DNA helicase RecQ|uniref:DNA 3'-5' helicase n=1 Tax=Limnospira platensis NIES-46 TaxID=1236695 RepID=A0A5M3T5B2_LIMPL|nr:DEAD/DEAH box helicase [Arthrospira platensis]MDF2209159.1 DEAD/DEAH box helicase [Arthrospira platensis NCB002]MDT9181274.1 DEAD/DEAH box helicase [Limnospira sp. PMC 289.06]QQW29515.1 DEAD/DEAH box helicase [Arthrospira sp. PCC 9108]BAI88049.1 ATP-dependent DNA helicase [Arthrospira platensis NIES-39]BDT10475.1 ATP-dependent DNA helicase [Arthrospira platensis NIES-39]